MSQENNSITQMLSKLGRGESEAVELIWRRFFERVVGLAKNKLGSLPKRVVDEEDIAISAINALYIGAQDGRFKQLNDRDDLWQILCMLTSRKVANAYRKQKSRPHIGESQLGPGVDDEQMLGIAHIATSVPDEAYFDELSIKCRELLENLDENLRHVAMMKLQGYKNQEIADQIGRSVKSVERYLKTIREEWSGEF
jgi:RNA polymerase sigma factor (sigma-70 family)